MTTTPTPWNDLTRANTSHAGAQAEVSVAALADGGYLVTWTDESNMLATQISAQRYDLFGHKAGGQIDIDQQSASASQSTSTGLSGGGVAVAFTNNADITAEIVVHRYSASLGSFATDTIGAGSAAAIAAFANGGYVVSQTVVQGGGTHINAHVVSASGVVGPALAINVTNPDDALSRVAVLSNGNFVVTYDFGGMQSDVHMEIRTGTGGLVLSDSAVAGADSGAAEESYNDVAALKNGGFVVAWEDNAGDSDDYGIRATIYDNAGVAVAADFQVNTTESGAQFSPFIAALADGGFIVSWEDDGGGHTRGQRFDATGHKIGHEFTIQDGQDNSSPSRAVELQDGRVAYGLGHNLGPADEDAETQIFDPRSNPINGTTGKDALTSRIDGAVVNGLGGKDALYGFAGADHLNGGKGADRLDGGAGGDTLRGGKGADRMHAGGGDDRDVFAFTSKHDSGHDDKSGWDRLYGFDAHGKHEAVSDKIDLSAIDADKHQKHDQAFRFVDHFKDAQGDQPAGEVTVADAGKNVKVLVDANGDGQADMIMLVMHVHDLHKADFLL